MYTVAYLFTCMSIRLRMQIVYVHHTSFHLAVFLLYYTLPIPFCGASSLNRALEARGAARMMLAIEGRPEKCRSCEFTMRWNAPSSRHVSYKDSESSVGWTSVACPRRGSRILPAVVLWGNGHVVLHALSEALLPVVCQYFSSCCACMMCCGCRVMCDRSRG
jgi:hypothetical protein